VIWALALVAATSTSTTPRFTYDCIYDGDVEGVLETSTTATTARDLRPPPIPKPEPAEEEDPLVPRELRYAKYAALIDGGWSAALTVGWLMSARAWDAPYPEGLTGLAVARILYGTTWSLLVTTGITILRLTSGESWEGLRFGELRNEWHLGFEIPGGCQDVESPSCGMGLGGFSELSVRLATDTVPVELLMTGGWIQGHHDTNAQRTLMESTWAQAPLLARARSGVSLGPLHLEAALGGGAYYGLHAAHVHARGEQRAALGTPFWEMVILHGGFGPGLHGKVWLTFFDTLTVEADADVAILALGGSNRGAPAVVQALDPFRYDGVVTWRRASVGLGLSRRVLHPVRLAARLYGAQLSPGPVTDLGHRTLMFQFEVPFDLEDKSDDEGESP
jgi:hypothetical protein